MLAHHLAQIQRDEDAHNLFSPSAVDAPEAGQGKWDACHRGTRPGAHGAFTTAKQDQRDAGQYAYGKLYPTPVPQCFPQPRVTVREWR